MGNIRVQLETLVPIAAAELLIAVFVQAMPAIVAIPGAQMILLVAMRAMVRELPGRHRQEQSIIAINQLHIPDNKRVVKSKGAKSLQTAPPLIAQINSNFGQLHVAPPVQNQG